jgi:hypothetical protein
MKFAQYALLPADSTNRSIFLLPLKTRREVHIKIKHCKLKEIIKPKHVLSRPVRVYAKNSYSPGSPKLGCVALVEKPKIAQLVEKLSRLYQPEGSLLCS